MYRALTRLKEHRQRRTLTQDELEKLSGVSRPTIAALELGYHEEDAIVVVQKIRYLKIENIL